MTTEADTCRKYVVKKLYNADWNDDQIREQVSFTDGRGAAGAAVPNARGVGRVVTVRAG